MDCLEGTWFVSSSDGLAGAGGGWPLFSKVTRGVSLPSSSSSWKLKGRWKNIKNLYCFGNLYFFFQNRLFTSVKYILLHGLEGFHFNVQNTSYSFTDAQHWCGSTSTSNVQFTFKSLAWKLKLPPGNWHHHTLSWCRFSGTCSPYEQFTEWCFLMHIYRFLIDWSNLMRLIRQHTVVHQLSWISQFRLITSLNANMGSGQRQQFKIVF